VDATTVNLAFPIRACWMKRGQQKRLPAPPGANAFQHVIGALNWRTQQVSYTLETIKNSDTFISFLEHLLEHCYPTQGIVLVMDNAPYHRSRAVQAMLSLYSERVLVFWLPPYCPTLNPIERFWRHLKDIATANWLYPSVDELLANVRRVLHAQNEPLHPLRLTFSHY
jgi:transposase